MHRTIALTIAVLLISVHSALAQGRQVQAEQGRGGRGGRTAVTDADRGPGEDTRVFRLSHADSDVLADHVQNVMGVPVVSDRRTNSLIATGSPDQLAQLDGLIQALDIPSQTDRGTETVNLFPIRFREPNDVANALTTLLAHRRARIGADRGRSIVAISGPLEVIRQADEIVQRMDTPPQSLQLEFTFFQADQHADEPPSEIPADLREVADELSRFGRIQLLGRMATSALEGDSFRVRGQILSGFNGEIKGDVDRVSNDGFAQIELNAELNLQKTDMGQGGFNILTGSFQLQTKIIAGPGEYVVLGSAPAGLSPGTSAILVVRSKPSGAGGAP